MVLIEGRRKENVVSPLTLEMAKSPLVIISIPIITPKAPSCSEHSVKRTFLIQECQPGNESYTQTFRTRVIF